MGIVTLSITIGTYPRQRTKEVDFLVVNCSSAYNAIIGRPTLNALRAATSTYHLLVKFLIEYGVKEARGDQAAVRECYVAMLDRDKQLSTMSIKDQRLVVKPMEKLEEVILDDDYPEIVIRMGTHAVDTTRQEFLLYLKSNIDVFARSHEDILGIDPRIMVHKLNISPYFTPIRQKKRAFAPERNEAIVEEV